MSKPEAEHLGLSRKENYPTIERAIKDIDLPLFVRSFMQPYRPNDSLEFMTHELIKFKPQRECGAYRKTIKELLSNPSARQAVNTFIVSAYECVDASEERLELFGNLEPEQYINLSSRQDIKKLIRVDHLILTALANSIKATDSIPCQSPVFDKLREHRNIIVNNKDYQAAIGLLDSMDNFGQGTSRVKYDYFKTVYGVEHIQYSKREQWKELVRWALRTLDVKCPLRSLFWFTSSYPEEGESKFAEAFDLLTKRNLSIAEEFLTFRRKADFFLAATRYVDALRSHNLPVLFPTIQENLDVHFNIKGLYNPCLLTQEDVIFSHRGMVPNDAVSLPDSSVTIITGPNNTGKSVYVKAVGLALTLAHNGFPIPATTAHIHQLDGIATHCTHPEDIEHGEGGLADELRRAKEDLMYASKRTFFLIDEPIKGTSPQDAKEISLRLISALRRLGAPAYITTHLHEVASAVDEWEGIQNMQTEFRIEKDKIIPSYKIVPGMAQTSHGVLLADELGFSEQALRDIIEKKT